MRVPDRCPVSEPPAATPAPAASPPRAAVPSPRADDVQALVRRHQQGLWRYLRALGADAAEAEELLHDAFVVAWRRGVRDDGDGRCATFLRRTARHLYHKHVRSRDRRRARLVEYADRLWHRRHGADDGEVWLRALRACVANLELRARRAIEACYGPGATRGARDRVAATLGLEPNGLKTLLQRTRERLRLCVRRRVEEHEA